MKIKQLKTSTKIGGLLILISEVMFIFQVLNFIMITRLNYYSSDDEFIREIFPSYYIFMSAMVFAGITGMLIAYMIIIPSKQKFNQEQAVKDDRSPTYRKILELEDKIDELINKTK